MAIEPVTAALEIGGKLIERLWPNPTDAAAAKLELIKLQQSGELAQLTAETEITKAQLAVNQAEASSDSLFVAGWRPFVGWCCGSALAYAAVMDPLMRFAATVGFGYAGEFPVIDTTITLQVLLGLLGLGGMRTFERVRGAIPQGK